MLKELDAKVKEEPIEKPLLKKLNANVKEEPI